MTTMASYSRQYGVLDGYTGQFTVCLQHKDCYLPEDSPDMAEAEIAACVDAWLRHHKYETYPEVQLRNHGKRPDLIATKSAVVMVVECKKSLGLTVLEQATSWFVPYHNDEKSGLPHLIYVACAKSRQHKNLPKMIMQNYGIGYIEVQKKPALFVGTGEKRERITPATYSLLVQLEARIVPGSRRLGKVLRAQLNPDTRIAIPGTTGTGQFMTDWKRTVLKIEELMKDGDTRTIADIVEWLTVNGGYHWCSRSSAQSGVLAVMKRQKYQQETYGSAGTYHRWRWAEGLTKPVLKGR